MQTHCRTTVLPTGTGLVIASFQSKINTEFVIAKRMPSCSINQISWEFYKVSRGVENIGRLRTVHLRKVKPCRNNGNSISISLIHTKTHLHHSTVPTVLNCRQILQHELLLLVSQTLRLHFYLSKASPVTSSSWTSNHRCIPCAPLLLKLILC